MVLEKLLCRAPSDQMPRRYSTAIARLLFPSLHCFSRIPTPHSTCFAPPPALHTASLFTQSASPSSANVLCPNPRLDNHAGLGPALLEKNIWAVERLGKGKRFSGHDRKNNRVPGYIYDHEHPDAAHVLIVLDKYQIHSLWSHLGEEKFLVTVFTLNVYDGLGSDRILYSQPVIPRRVNFSTQGLICNVGFLRAPPGMKLRLDSPLHFCGRENCIGIKKGGHLQQSLSYITFFCLPSELPPRIDVNVDHLDIGDEISVEDLQLKIPLHPNLEQSSTVCKIV